MKAKYKHIVVLMDCDMFPGCYTHAQFAHAHATHPYQAITPVMVKCPTHGWKQQLVIIVLLYKDGVTYLLQRTSIFVKQVDDSVHL